MTQPYLLILKKGEMLHDALIAHVEKQQFNGIAFSGLGALRNIVLGFFDEATTKYVEKKFDGMHELLSLTGNVSKADGKWLAHIHVVLGDETYNAIGSHLISAEVAITAEILVTPLDETPRRVFDKETGLKLIQ